MKEKNIEFIIVIGIILLLAYNMGFKMTITPSVELDVNIPVGENLSISYNYCKSMDINLNNTGILSYATNDC